MKIKSYKELNVWKMGIEIVDLVYEMVSQFPKDEKYGLATQMQRSAISIPSNIAEGFARHSAGSFRQFCYVALGSCAELETQTILAQRRSYVAVREVVALEERLDHESKMLMNLIKTLR